MLSCKVSPVNVRKKSDNYLLLDGHNLANTRRPWHCFSQIPRIKFLLLKLPPPPDMFSQHILPGDDKIRSQD